jgi:predicted nucleic acid-binding protein
LSIDFARAVRRRKPEKRRVQLKVRPPSKLIGAADPGDAARYGLVPDTNVYILEVAEKLPPEAEALFNGELLFHCSVCLAELAVGLAHTNPSLHNWKTTHDYYVQLFATVPDTRLLVPDDQIWTEAGLIAGTLARTQGYQKAQLKECLNDTLIYLTAAKEGLPVLTHNRDDFDLIQQLAPEGSFIHF